MTFVLHKPQLDDCIMLMYDLLLQRFCCVTQFGITIPILCGVSFCAGHATVHCLTYLR